MTNFILFFFLTYFLSLKSSFLFLVFIPHQDYKDMLSFQHIPCCFYYQVRKIKLFEPSYVKDKFHIFPVIQVVLWICFRFLDIYIQNSSRTVEWDLLLRKVYLLMFPRIPFAFFSPATHDSLLLFYRHL